MASVILKNYNITNFGLNTPAPDMTALVTLEVQSPGDNDSVLQVPVRSRFSLKTQSVSLCHCRPGNHTFYSSKTVFKQWSNNGFSGYITAKHINMRGKIKLYVVSGTHKSHNFKPVKIKHKGIMLGATKKSRDVLGRAISLYQTYVSGKTKNNSKPARLFKANC